MPCRRPKIPSLSAHEELSAPDGVDDFEEELLRAIPDPDSQDPKQHMARQFWRDHLQQYSPLRAQAQKMIPLLTFTNANPTGYVKQAKGRDKGPSFTGDPAELAKGAPSSGTLFHYVCQYALPLCRDRAPFCTDCGREFSSVPRRVRFTRADPRLRNVIGVFNWWTSSWDVVCQGVWSQRVQNTASV